MSIKKEEAWLGEIKGIFNKNRRGKST